jgi:hypothetical protein
VPNLPCSGPPDADLLSLVDLQRCREQARDAWRSSADSHVPLPLAAALAFHAGEEGAKALLPARDYDAALNSAAAALSRLVAVYAIGENSKLPAVIPIDLGSGRFRDGGALYERRRGPRVTSLVVARAQLEPALEFIRRAGLPSLVPGTGAERA